MKRLVSLIMTAIICLCIVPMLTGCSEPKNNYVGWSGNYQDSFLYDDKNLFSGVQRQELDEMVQQKAKELEMNILIYVNGTYRSDGETKEFCDVTYEAFFAPDSDGIMYYLDLSSKVPAYDYISTSGKAILLYENCREDIFNHMDLYLPSSGSSYESDQIYEAVVEFLNQLTIYSNRSSSNPSYYHDKSKDTYIYYKGDKLYITTKKPLRVLLPIWFASGIIGLVTALITFLISKRHYTFKAKTNPSIYLSKDAVNFTQRSDNHIRTYQTRHRISSSSSGGSSHRSGGGGGHHSSGSHGGGGHHR